MLSPGSRKGLLVIFALAGMLVLILISLSQNSPQQRGTTEETERANCPLFADESKRLPRYPGSLRSWASAGPGDRDTSRRAADAMCARQ